MDLPANGGDDCLNGAVEKFEGSTFAVVVLTTCEEDVVLGCGVTNAVSEILRSWSDSTFAVGPPRRCEAEVVTLVNGELGSNGSEVLFSW